jgi:thiamine transport system substrate-binding protein
LNLNRIMPAEGRHDVLRIGFPRSFWRKMMRSRFLFFPTLFALVASGHSGAAQERPVLTVYTYDSFVSEWGPGPAVTEAFEAECGCTLRLVGAGDGAAMLGRLRLEGRRSAADVVLGLDTNLVAEATASGLLVEHGLDLPSLDLPVAWEDPVFVPFDWGYLSFVYDETRTPDVPGSFRALAESDLSVVIQDPRSSTPGLGLLLWVKAAYGDEAAAVWEALAPRVLTVTPGWSAAYGLFVNGEADMVLSYTTSPAYHLIAEEDPTKAAAIFEEGHYLQIEVAGVTANAAEPELARQFLRFMLSDAFQGVLPTTNWMYPARTPDNGLPDGFDELAMPGTALLLSPSDARDLRQEALDEWLHALSR